ncbi:MAG: elongation factor EF-2 [Nanoarchaeota archaeon]|nr:elongation factor EF-2 [Nanoarchaeota archaeon]
MVKETDLTKKVVSLMNDPKYIRNMGIVAHIDHGKTTLSDSLLVGAGMLSEKVAGEARSLDFLEEEQARGITIQSSNINMVHTFDGKEFLINLIDTPGHVDFGGDVTRAMRAVDGALVLVDAVEGAMPQTETVLRQALKERVKPVLFINKVDRLMKELRLKPEDMQARFVKTIASINKLIKDFAPNEFKKAWQVNVMDGTVAFGSAVDKWALSFTYMKEKGIGLSEVIKAYVEKDEEAIKQLGVKAPLADVLLDMMVKHFPNPLQAQKYRIPAIWQGDLENTEGKAMMSCDANGPVIVEITKIVVDEYGEVATGRLFSGTIKPGMELNLIKAGVSERIQNVNIYKGAKRMNIEKAVAGNIIGITGLKNAFSGETLSSIKMDSFEDIKHIFEPVVTKSIEAKNPKDLPKLINVLKDIEKEDPTLKVSINEETGEFLISGLGELHLEWIEQKIQKYKGVEVQTSSPIVVYRESVTNKSESFEGKSPNKHNKFYMSVELLDEPIYLALKNKQIDAKRVRPKDKDYWKELAELGMGKDDAKNVKDTYDDSALLDMTKGIVQIREVLPMVIDAFEEVVRSGPLGREPCIALKVRLNDMKLHEDAIHRGPAQVVPAVREAIRQAVLHAGPCLYEPIREIRVDAPNEYLSAISSVIQARRGNLLGMDQEGAALVITAKMPVADSFGFTSDLRSATSGRAVWSLKNITFEPLPKSLQEDVVRKIRQRKGLADTQI